MRFKLIESKDRTLIPITDELIKKYPIMKHIRTGEKHNGYALMSQDDLIGFVSVESKPDGNWIQGLEIDKKYQGKGFGKYLLNVACTKLGATKLSVRKTNKKAIELYKNYGFNTFDETDFMYFMRLSNSIDESLHKLQSDSFITDSPYDIKNLIKNKPDFYRIFYDKKIDSYIICEGTYQIHQDMINDAIKCGYYYGITHDDEPIDKYNIYSYIDDGIYGYYEDDDDDSSWVDPWLYYLIFIPYNDKTFGYIHSVKEDGYEKLYHYDFGIIATRNCDFKEIDLYKILGRPNSVESLFN